MVFHLDDDLDMWLEQFLCKPQMWQVWSEEDQIPIFIFGKVIANFTLPVAIGDEYDFIFWVEVPIG